MGGIHHKTKTIKSTLNPKYDKVSSTFTHSFEVGDVAKIHMTVMDQDLIGSNDLCGMVSLTPTSGVKWYVLTAKDGSTEEPLDEVELRIRLDDEQLDNKLDDLDMNVVLTIIQARGLKAMDRGGSSDPFVTVRVSIAQKQAPR